MLHFPHPISYLATDKRIRIRDPVVFALKPTLLFPLLLFISANVRLGVMHLRRVPRPETTLPGWDDAGGSVSMDIYQLVPGYGYNVSSAEAD